MQAADDVKFGDGLTVSRGGGFKSFIERHGIGAGRVLLAAEGAEPARRYADVRGIDVAIDVEIRLVAMHALADVVGHPAHGENISAAVESESVVRIQPLAGQDLGVNRFQPRVVGLKRMVLLQGRHPLDDIAGSQWKSQKDGFSGLR